MNAPDSSTGFEAVGEDLRLETITDGAAFVALGERWDGVPRVEGRLRPARNAEYCLTGVAGRVYQTASVPVED